jgi:hypothetical protein
MSFWLHLATLSLFLIPTTAAAEFISGIVMDPNHQPIEKVRVRWQARAAVVLTDDSGRFNISFYCEKIFHSLLICF